MDQIKPDQNKPCCRLCGAEGLKTHYSGLIRLGKFGTRSPTPRNTYVAPVSLMVGMVFH